MAKNQYYDTTGDREFKRSCYVAILDDTTNATAQWTTEDVLTRYVNVDLTTVPHTVISEFWVNQTTGETILAPLVFPVEGTDVVPCPNGATTDVETQLLYDTDETGSSSSPTATRGQVTPFIRVTVYDLDTGQPTAGLTPVDLEIDGATPYVPTGTVAPEPIRVLIGAETITTGATVAGMTPPNTHSNLAEGHVWTDDILYTLVGVAPVAGSARRQNDGAHFEVETDESIAQFQAITKNGLAGTIYVEYYNIIKSNA